MQFLPTSCREGFLAFISDHMTRLSTQPGSFDVDAIADVVVLLGRIQVSPMDDGIITNNPSHHCIVNFKGMPRLLTQSNK